MFLPLIFFRLNLIKRSLKSVISRGKQVQEIPLSWVQNTNNWEKDVQIEFGNRKGGF